MTMTVGEVRAQALQDKLNNAQINAIQSKRENFAMHAMNGLLAGGMEDAGKVARMSVLLADEMIKALKEPSL